MNGAKVKAAFNVNVQSSFASRVAFTVVGILLILPVMCKMSKMSICFLHW